MKIGILTLPLHTNYGGILQAFALSKTLEKMGHDVWLIDTNFKKLPLKKEVKFVIKQVIDRLNGKSDILFPQRLRKSAYKKYTKPFIDKYIPKITETFESLDEIEKNIAKYKFDAVVVGSDQIWNSKYFKYIEAAYFSFIKDPNVIKLSYAPSFGSDTWIYSPEQTKNCMKLISSFNAVSVREDLGVEFCKKYFDLNASFVLDPTFLLEVQDYFDLLGNEKKLSKGNMFCYVLDNNPDKMKIIQDIADEHALKPFQLDIIDGYDSSPLEWRTKAYVEDWIRAFYNAEFVVTDSFHGTVFSIIFNKPFFSLINYSRGGARFKSLLKLFNLEDRIISPENKTTPESFKNQINWDSVNLILKERKEFSKEFLLQALNKTN
jgi:hypothetical protein